MSTENIIQYVPWSSFVDSGFWHTLTRLKLEVSQLSEEPLEISGVSSHRVDLPALLDLDGTAFNKVPRAPPFYENIPGTLIHKNTIESFKEVDKTELLHSYGEKYWAECVASKAWISSPNKLSKFILLAFSDLKKYHYYYWFAFPAPSQPTVYFARNAQPLIELFDDKQIHSLSECHKALDKAQKQFFIVISSSDNLEVKPLSSILDDGLKSQDLSLTDVYFGFLDPSNGINPGWPLRNYVAALLEHCPSLAGSKVGFIGLRCRMEGDVNASVYYIISIPENACSVPKNGWVGWERNDRGKFGPKLANMSASMDPIKLAEASAELNLKLMKWRLVPNIDLDLMKDTKCLLLGAGTLGCHVARDLLAWGFRHITFLDNGKVSYSNPVRQVLYNHNDCLDGGLKKATAAAESMKRILPTVNASGLVSHIPMPGHPVGESLKQETLNSIDVITKAITEHDVIFLLLDTREARWLPTMIAAHHGKIVINAALGFDSYLVMRHGTAQTSSSVPTPTTEYVSGHELGCYFCNDVTAPGNSLKDRTLDQQCTVTRPGVAAIAAALAVEMTVGLLQHRLRINAPAAYNLSKSLDEGINPSAQGILGPIPHSIRGFLWSYNTVVPTCVKFKQCIACSEHVINEYLKDGNDFLMKVFGDASYLERITGLTELHLAAEMIDVLELSDQDEDETICKK